MELWRTQRPLRGMPAGPGAVGIPGWSMPGWRRRLGLLLAGGRPRHLGPVLPGWRRRLGLLLAGGRHRDRAASIAESRLGARLNRRSPRDCDGRRGGRPTRCLRRTGRRGLICHLWPAGRGRIRRGCTRAALATGHHAEQSWRMAMGRLDEGLARHMFRRA